MALAAPGAVLPLQSRPRRRRAPPAHAPRAVLPEVSRRAVDAVGAWLVAHPAPLWLVNNPLKAAFTRATAGAYDEAAVRQELDALLADDVVLFSATYCPFSARAKAELAAQRVPYTLHETNLMPNGAALISELGKRTGRTSIPHLWIAGQSIGGCNDGTPGLRPLIASGGLEAALDKCSPAYKARRSALLAGQQA